MKREEKSEEGLAEKEKNLCEKLSRRVLSVGNRKTEGPCTPLPSWKLYDPQSHLHHNNSLLPPPAAVSARKLAASLWEFHQYLPHRPHNSKMHRRGVNNTNDRYTQRLHHNKNKAIDFSHFLADPCPSSDPDQPESSSSLRRHIAQTLMKHHRSIEKSKQAVQPVSPASYGSSMEVAPYNPAVTPSSSISFRGRIGESHYNLKTSTELLKNQGFASRPAACRLEINDLMKQIAEDKLVRKSKEQDRVHAAVQSARDELEDERKLRKRSENLHRKLAREVSDSKASLSNALKDLERERKSRKLLEDLCDEFARGIKNYELDLHTLRQKSDEDWKGVADHDLDRLGFEIETFLQAKQSCTSVSKRTDYLSQKDRRKSLESVPLNEAARADEALNCDDEEIMKSNHAERKLSSHEKIKSRHSSSLQVRFEEKMARAMSNENKKSLLADAEEENIVGNATEATISQKLENDEATQYGNEGRKNKFDEIHGLSSNYIVDNLMRNHIIPGAAMDDKFTPPDLDVSESSVKLPPATKDNTLKAMLLEARSKGLRSRLKILRGKS
ncbi:Lactoylglutathione lyase / glyoxalase I family protein [Hibiscus syriacus]|uniref:Lactoylglutathione lyase / glyoxalase I family protein n=1 Tax=Hibiscus syriacus TaxID=106335 RepID=A0A6A3B7G8_HIBSY|nr:Lactoylglutathione lyase / glyoxalase I family protein [Hibiscus syriacus]